jgi:NTP pyrophosphatase (non-canonical NTP hydrolase)
MSITIEEAQARVDKWIKTIGVRYFNELTNTAILMEEVGEVARIMARKYGEQSYKKSDESVDLADEMADVMWVLICLANQTGINLTEAFERNIVKKTQRDLDRHKTNNKL